MGLGKTASVIYALSDLYCIGEMRKALVVAPLRVTLNVWPNEVKKWEGHELSTSLIRGTEDDRIEKLADPAPVHLINREMLPWLVQRFDKGDWPYCTVVLDESSSFKSRATQRFRALRARRHRVERLIELTGTPCANSLMDLWPQVFLLDRGERLFKTITKFRNTWFAENPYAHTWASKPGAEKAISERVADITLRMKASDYLDMPETTLNTVRVTLPPKAHKAYRSLERNFLLRLENDETLLVHNSAVLINKLLQCADGALYTDDEGAYTKLHDAKLDALGEIVESLGGEPLLVATNYRSVRSLIVDRFKAVELDKDPETINRWNRKEIPVMVAHPASGGHGLNLQGGGHTLAWVGLPWSRELYDQFNARLVRQGQSSACVIHHILADDTADWQVWGALKSKNATQQQVLDLVAEAARARQS